MHRGTNATVFYTWDGHKKFWGSRLGSCLARAERLDALDKASGITIRVAGKMYSIPEIRKILSGR